MLIESTLPQFLEALQARKPTPGGGSVAALSGALGASLLVMALRYSVGKNTTEADRLTLEQATARATLLASELLDQVDRDAAAYDAVVRAARDAREDPGDPARAERAERAIQHAAEVPLETALASMQALESIEVLHGKLNKNLSSDALVATHCLHAAVLGAVLNVRVNLPSLKRAELRASLAVEADRLSARADDIALRLRASIAV
ncbi:MAG: cyclodeaminase/cyclohydrolase family protein [Planctomycetota bacterium]